LRLGTTDRLPTADTLAVVDAGSRISGIGQVRVNRFSGGVGEPSPAERVNQLVMRHLIGIRQPGTPRDGAQGGEIQIRV
jgi:hypothetical protein